MFSLLNNGDSKPRVLFTGNRPTEEETDEFFAKAEREEQKRFAEK